MRLEANARTWTVCGIAVFAAMAVSAFWQVLPWYLAPVAPDAGPYFPFGNRTVTLESLLSTGGEVTPQHLYWLIFHPLLANKLDYLIDTLFLALAGVYYLRGRGAGYPAAWVGGLALGFSGYTFSLFSAGHRGHFDMFACAVFSFGLLVRCFTGVRWFHFAMLGACLAWGVAYQPDLITFLGLLLVAYVLWLTFAPRVDAAMRPWQRVRRVWPRFLLTAVVGVAIGWPGIRTAVTQQMSGRKDQIANALSSATATTESAEARKFDQWIFATNWSLPPEDIAEFIVPGIYGNDSMQEPYPYWGRLGRPYDWEPGRRIMPNYRQHTLYLGALSVCFAMFALLLWRAERRRRDASAAPANAGLLVDVPFWIGAGGVCMLLALGRYTPAYRIIYAVPYLDLIRCPAKFHHLVEICCAFLCGLGVEAWLRGAVVTAPAKRGTALDPQPTAVVGRRMTVVAAVVMVVLLLAAGVVATSSTEIAEHIARLGLGPYGERLAGYAARNLARSACVFSVAALLFWLGRPRVGRGQPSATLLGVLVLVLAVDLVTVAQRFMHPVDTRPSYAGHVVSATALARGGMGARVASYIATNDPARDWFADSLQWHGLQLALDGESGSTAAAVKQTLGNRPETLWRTTHAGFVIAPWRAAAPLVKSQELEPLVSFALGQGTVRQAQPSADTFVLAAFAGAMPAAYVVEGVQGGLSEAAQVQRMSVGAWDPARMTLFDAPGPTGGESRVIGKVQVIARRGSDFRLITTLDVETPRAGLLVSDERYADHMLARVDGREVPVHCANALWAAVDVTAGHHTVTLWRREQAACVLLSAGVGLLVIVWGLSRLLGWWRHSSKPTARTLQQMVPPAA